MTQAFTGNTDSNWQSAGYGLELNIESYEEDSTGCWADGWRFKTTCEPVRNQ